MLLFCMSAAYLAAQPDTVTEFRASAGHMTFWETPETWGAAVTEWLGVQAFG